MPTRKSTRERIQRFAFTLSLALNDKKIELMHNKPIIFYYDNDVVFKMMLGFEQELLPRQRKINSDERLVRALMSYGYLGDVHLLRPHAMELNKLLFEHPKKAIVEVDEIRKRKAKKYLQDKGVYQVMTTLRNIVSEGGPLDELSKREGINKFIDHLGKQPGNTFAYLAQVHGNWAERFIRFRQKDLIKFDKLGPEITIIQKDLEDTIYSFYSKLIETKSRSELKLNTYTDSLSLAILNYFIDRRDSGETDETVRFYTETAVVANSLNVYPETHDLLCYRKPIILHNSNTLKEEFILRDKDYFKMRAWFHVLSPDKLTRKDERESDVSISGTSLNELINLSTKLDSLLAYDDMNLEIAFHTTQFRRMYYDVLISEFEQLAIMDSVWIGNQFPEDLKKFDILKEWVDVLDFAAQSMTNEELQKRINSIRIELENKLSVSNSSMKNFEGILNASKERVKTFKGKNIDSMRDLGLVRWGYALDDESRKSVINSIKTITQGEDFERMQEIGNLASRMELGKSYSKEKLISCGILWALGLYKDIIALVGESPIESETNYELSLRVIKNAAKMRLGDLSYDEIKVVVDETISLLGKSDNILLGVGYVLFHAWDKVKDQVVDRNSMMELKSWAERSFAIGREAAEVFSKSDKLSWAHSINHCAYVGTMTGIYPTETNQFIKILFEISDRQALWNYRFSDTAGCICISRAEKLLKENHISEDDMHRIEENLKLAETYLAKAEKESLGDIASNAHRDWLDRVFMQLREKKGQTKM